MSPTSYQAAPPRREILPEALPRVKCFPSKARERIRASAHPNRENLGGFVESSGSAGLAAGSMLQRYRILEPLGSGGIGEVYRAHDERLGREVALKILRLDACNPDAGERLRREARTLSQLSHPGISTVHDVESADGFDFIVMELVSG